MNKLFILQPTALKSLFGSTPIVKGTPGSTLTTVGQNFVAIGESLSEGKISPEYAEIAVQKMHEAYLAVQEAVVHGWNNGQGAQY